jgi:hypothetical protein
MARKWCRRCHQRPTAASVVAAVLLLGTAYVRLHGPDNGVIGAGSRRPAVSVASPAVPSAAPQRPPAPVPHAPTPVPVGAPPAVTPPPLPAAAAADWSKALAGLGLRCCTCSTPARLSSCEMCGQWRSLDGINTRGEWEEDPNVMAVADRDERWGRAGIMRGGGASIVGGRMPHDITGKQTYAAEPLSRLPVPSGWLWTNAVFGDADTNRCLVNRRQAADAQSCLCVRSPPI